MSPRSDNFRAVLHGLDVGRATVGISTIFFTNLDCPDDSYLFPFTATSLLKAEISGGIEGGVHDPPPISAIEPIVVLENLAGSETLETSRIPNLK